MARTERGVEDLQKIHHDLMQVANRVSRAIDKMKNSKISSVWAHWTTIETVALPRLIDWAIGVESTIEKHKATRDLPKNLRAGAEYEVEKYRRYGKGKDPTADTSSGKQNRSKTQLRKAE